MSLSRAMASTTFLTRSSKAILSFGVVTILISLWGLRMSSDEYPVEMAIFFHEVIEALLQAFFYQYRHYLHARAYIQFSGSEFHSRNARSRQLQEQRRAKAG